MFRHRVPPQEQAIPNGVPGIVYGNRFATYKVLLVVDVHMPQKHGVTGFDPCPRWSGSRNQHGAATCFPLKS